MNVPWAPAATLTWTGGAVTGEPAVMPQPVSTNEAPRPDTATRAGINGLSFMAVLLE